MIKNSVLIGAFLLAVPLCAMPAGGASAAQKTLTQNAATPGAPPVGVYGCLGQNMMEVLTLQWGIVDASTYSTYDGGRGRYSFDPTTSVLTFETGPFKGLKRKRTSGQAFRVLDEHGALTGINCPWVHKNPTKLHW